MTDFLIVGRGLAATVLMHRFYEQNLSFVVVGSDALSTSSRVAAGLWNPVVFKRMTGSWMASELVAALLAFYERCEARLNCKLVHTKRIVKPFAEEQEATLWKKKAANELHGFLNPSLSPDIGDELRNCKAGSQYGEVLKAGHLNLPAFLDYSTRFFAKHIHDAEFIHAQLVVGSNSVSYNGISARNIVFCEGFLVKQNPLFSWVPLKPAKGEVLNITSEDLELKHTIFNKNGFVLRHSNNQFKVGATYAWNDLTQVPTELGRNELEAKLKHLIACNYTITGHEAGIRPASVDRRPIIGAHPVYPNAFVFNGLGTKGVMLAPYFSENFVNFYLQKTALNADVDVVRFYRFYEEEKKEKN